MISKNKFIFKMLKRKKDINEKATAKEYLIRWIFIQYKNFPF